LPSIVAVNLVGKYLRLRRDLLEPGGPAKAGASYRRRVARELVAIGDELQLQHPEKIPFIDTMPWCDTLVRSEISGARRDPEK